LVAPAWFFGFDSLMEFIAFAIAIAVAYQALKGYRLSKERTLLYLNFSFVMLGTGLLVDGLANILLLASRLDRAFIFLSGVGHTINFITQVIAYGILVVAYIHQARTLSTQAAATGAAVVFFQQNAFAELIIIMLLVYILAQTAINYGISRTANSLLVLCAFASLTLAHMFFLIFTLAPIFFALGHIAQLFGFLLLLAMLLRVNQS